MKRVYTASYRIAWLAGNERTKIHDIAFVCDEDATLGDKYNMATEWIHKTECNPIVIIDIYPKSCEQMTKEADRDKIQIKPTFEVGDVVRLKSGSVEMVIENLDNCQTATCIYWDENTKEYERLMTNPNCLTKS